MGYFYIALGLLLAMIIILKFEEEKSNSRADLISRERQEKLIAQQKQEELERQKKLIAQQKQEELERQKKLIVQQKQEELERQEKLIAQQRELEIEQKYKNDIEDYLNACDQLSKTENFYPSLNHEQYYKEYLKKESLKIVLNEKFELNLYTVENLEHLDFEIDLHYYSLNDVKEVFPQIIKLCSGYYSELTVIHGYNKGTAIRDYVRSYSDKNIISMTKELYNDGITIFKIYNKELIEKRIKSRLIEKKVHNRIESEEKEKRVQINKIKLNIKELREKLANVNIFEDDIIRYKESKNYKILQSRILKSEIDKLDRIKRKEKERQDKEEERKKEVEAKKEIALLLNEFEDEQREVYEKLSSGIISFYQVPISLLTKDFYLFIKKRYLLYNKIDSKYRKYIESVIKND